MSDELTLLQRAQRIVATWDEHFVMYAQSKRSIRELRASYTLMEQQIQQLKDRAAATRAKAKATPAAQRVDLEPEIESLEQDIARHEAKLFDRKQQIGELEQRLEQSWDIW